MKKKFILIAVSLPIILVTISCSNKNNTNNDSTQADSLKKEQSELVDNNEIEDSIVIINDDGTTNGNHVYVTKDDNSFYLDYVGYEIVQSHIDVKAYDLAAIEGDVKIGSKIKRNNNTYDVLRIGENAFYGCQRITSVSIPSSVRIILESAFEWCPNLSSVKLSNGLKSIGKKAFSRCEKLTSIIIPSSVDNIGENAFASTRSLESIIVENSNEIYDSRNNCNAIIETASNTLIQGCKSTVIPENVVKIGPGAFWFCKDLTSMVIPNSVVTIGHGAFDNCQELKSLKISNSVKEIGYMAFSGCSKLESITIPDKVSKIEDRTFSGCTNLTTVKLGSSIDYLGEEIFEGCPNLSKIFISAITPPSLAYATFNKMEVEPYEVEIHVPMDAVEQYENARGWKAFTIVGY